MPSALASRVACLWSRDDAPARVLPDGCVDLIWTGGGIIVAGPATQAVVPEPSPAGQKLGVRLRIGAAAAVLGMPAAELLNRSPPLREVLARWRRAGGAHGSGDWAGGARGRPDERRHDADRPRAGAEATVRATVRALRELRTRITALPERLGISERHLRRRFEVAVGVLPQHAARILRLQRFLSLAVHGDLAGWRPTPATPTSRTSRTTAAG